MVSSKKKLGLIIVLGIAILILLPVYFSVADNDPGNESDFSLCTGAVSQPACYSGASTPLLNWQVAETGSSQVAYRVQVDDSSNFLSLAINTADVFSTDKFYQVQAAGNLAYNTLYYWRVRILDNVGSYSDWEAVDSFTTNSSCSSGPTATSPSISASSAATYCGTARHNFSWVYSDLDDDLETQFQFQVDNNSDFSSPGVDRTFSGLSNPSPTTNEQTVVVVNSPGTDQLGYNTTYYWRIKVWDDSPADSGWVSGSSFTTGLHQYPLINFSWAPLNPSQREDVQFADQSNVYGGASKSAWSWVFVDGDPGSSTSQNPTIQFVSSGSKQVALQITDSDGFSCSDNSQSVSVGWTLPDWREILPW